MKSLKPLLLVGSLLLSSMAWAEGGSDRVFERVQQMRDKAEAVLIQAEKAPVSERHVHMKEHMNMLEDIMSQLHNEHPAPEHVRRRASGLDGKARQAGRRRAGSDDS